jgi:DNA-binding transcriptional regulator YdaS (Cro superfamily)
LKHFKTQREIARVLGIKEQSVGQWKKVGVVPLLRATQLQGLTRGKVRVDPKVYERAGAKTSA